MEIDNSNPAIKNAMDDLDNEGTKDEANFSDDDKKSNSGELKKDEIKRNESKSLLNTNMNGYQTLYKTPTKDQ